MTTGEENEDTRHQVRARLYQLDDRGSYKERGTGILKINVRKNDGSTARIGEPMCNLLSSHSSLFNLPLQLCELMECIV